MATPTVTFDTRTVETGDAILAYDVYGPLPPADGRPPLLLTGAPMDASGFRALAALFPDRTVVTYDPRGLGRSTRKDGHIRHTPEQNADDVHAVIAELGAGPVELFATSGGAISALALVTRYPADVTTLVAHEPPLLTVLPDAENALAAEAAWQAAYHEKGSGAGMAGFIAATMWQGEFTDEYLRRPLPDPSSFGLPTGDDGSREDPLLSGISNAITSYRPDFAALAVGPTRIVVAVGVESQGTLTARTSIATAEALGQEPVWFPSHHAGFVGGDRPHAGQPEAFAARLREVL